MIRPPITHEAPAKLNLGLHVLRKRPDGYHDLATVFIRLPWHDVLTARPANRFHFTCSDPALPTGKGNLCVQAAHHLIDTFNVTQGAALHLEKRLPYGAGLGGGSSDAAATLRLLDHFWDLNAPVERLHSIALTLGSDVPFFLGPEAAYATGRGEQLTPLLDAETAEPYRLPFALVVVVPDVLIATAEAYRLVRPRAEGRADLRAVVCSNDLARWRRELINDFEAPIFRAHPAVAAVKAMLLDAGAGYAALSGSGAAVFGVFEHDTTATAAAEAARHAGHRVWQGRV